MNDGKIRQSPAQKGAPRHWLRRREASLAGLWAGALLLVLLLGGGCPQPPEEPIQVSVQSGNEIPHQSPEEILELARAEGELSWYTSLPEEHANLILARFSQKYPFIHTRLERGGSFTIAEKVYEERRAGRAQVDVLHLLEPATFVQLRNQGALLHYDTPEAHDIPAAYKDPGFWTALRAVTLCLAYDPRRVNRGEAPAGWSDLLAPRFRGRIGVKNAETAGSAYALYFLLRERYGTIFGEQLAAQQPKIYQTASQMLEALDGGEIDAALGMLGYAAYQAQQQGQSLELVWPAEGVPMMVGPVAILAAAPHPNCAKLFEDFLLGPEGQQLMNDPVGAYSLRAGAAPPPGRLPLTELHLLWPTAGWGDYATKRELLRKEFSNLLGTGGE